MSSLPGANIAVSPHVLRALQIGTVTSLTFLSGLSFCLTTWVTPVILTNSPSHSPSQSAAQRTRTLTAQFSRTIAQGGAYLQPTSRVLAAALLSLTYLTSHHPDPAVAAKWRYWATALGVLLPVAPYEIYAIFWINDRIEALGRELAVGGGAGEGKGNGSDEKDRKREQEVRMLLKKWAIRNLGRVTLPLVASVIGFVGLLSE